MVDKSHIGKEFPPFYCEVEKGAIRRFMEAIEDDNPVFLNEAAAKEAGLAGIIAPPTFGTTFTHQPGGAPSWEALDIDLQRVLHGEQEYEYLKPIHPGDKLKGVPRVVNVYQKAGKSGTMDFAVIETTFTDDAGETVLISRSTLVVRR